MNVVCCLTPAQLDLAQMAEYETFKLRVVGSTPTLGNTFSSTTHFLPKYKDKMNHRPRYTFPWLHQGYSYKKSTKL